MLSLARALARAPRRDVIISRPKFRDNGRVSDFRASAAQKSLIKLSPDRGWYLAIISLRGAFRNLLGGTPVETTPRANKNIVWLRSTPSLRRAVPKSREQRGTITVILLAAPIVTSRLRGIHRESHSSHFRLFFFFPRQSGRLRRRALSTTARGTSLTRCS